MKRALAAAVLLLVAASASAQLGSIAFPNRGKPEAQEAFLRGVSALHSFWYDEAADAFREAQRLDPAFVMAYWGEAMTCNHPIWREVDLPAGRAVLAKLAPNPGKSDARENGYLEAVETLYGEGDKSARDRAYETAMERLARAWPDDVEAQAFHALSILATIDPDHPDPRKQIRAAAILEPLYTAHPDHPGVLHYLIHAYDDPLHAPLGLRAAQRYAKVAPSAFHALHMPSHIFLQLGMWGETAASNEQSYAASKEWVERRRLGRAKRDLHSLQWLQYAYLQQGRFEDAKKLLLEVSPVEGEDARESSTRALMQARQAVESGDWSVLPALPSAGPAAEVSEHAGCGKPSYGNSSSALLFARGLAAVSRNDQKQARKAVAGLRAMRGADNDTRSRGIDVMAKELEASIEAASGPVSSPGFLRALELARAAVDIEETLGAPSGPPDPLKPAHELYAELLEKGGPAVQAVQQYRLSLLRTPNRRRSAEGAKRLAQRPTPAPPQPPTIGLAPPGSVNWAAVST
jgi:tetratricopeptide (TPR) repeat protein